MYLLLTTRKNKENKRISGFEWFVGVGPANSVLRFKGLSRNQPIRINRRLYDDIVSKQRKSTNILTMKNSLNAILTAAKAFIRFVNEQ